MEAYLNALMTIMQPSHLLIIVIASVLGIVLGAIPGLSGGLGISLLLPLTFGMSPTMGFSMLIGVWIGGVSGGFIASTLVGIPGTPSSIATCFDAYPMSQRGETKRALTIGIMGSFLGTFLSIIIATLMSPIIAEIALKLGPWEYFSLCFCALTLVASLAKDGMAKGLLATFLGLFVCCIGTDMITYSQRFTFGNIYLVSGVDMVAMMMGTFAIKQIVMNYAQGSQEMPEVKISKMKGFGIPLKDITENIGIIFRSFFIGLWIGFLPGMGGGLSNMLAYVQAKTSSKKPEEYGTGCAGGIWASEVANNASVGGAIMPMMALGIPGDGVTALLMSGLMIHGLQPGPLLISSNPDIAYLIFAAVLVSAVLVLIMQLLGKSYFPYLLRIPYHYLYSVILIMVFVGSYTSSGSMFTVFMVFIFALLGVAMDMANIPMSPFLLAFILGPKLEEYFRKGISYSGSYSTFFTRPVSLIFLLVAVVSVVWPYIKPLLGKKKQAV